MITIAPQRKVGEILRLSYGKPLPQSERVLEGGFPAYGANGVLCLAARPLRAEPSIIVGRKGSAGEVRLTNGPFWPTDVTYFVEHDRRHTDLNYLFHCLKYLNLQRVAKGVKPGINRNDVYGMSVRVPELKEQKRIVAILDEAFEGIDAAIANTEKNLLNADEMFNTYLKLTFTQKIGTWSKKSLAEIGRIQTGATPKTSDKDNIGTHIPFIKPGDFRKDGSLDYENEGLSKLGLTQSRLIRSGSAVMVCIGATIGKAGFADRDISANQQINAITPGDGIAGKFLYYQMISDGFQRQVIHNSAQATLPIINKTKWGALFLLLPPSRLEQEQLVGKLDRLSSEIQRLKETYRKKLASVADLKQAILQKAFAGKLTARGAESDQEAAE